MRLKKPAREMPQTAPPGENTMYYAQLKGKKLLWDEVQLQVTGVGLLIFEKGKLRDTYDYESLVKWNEKDNGIELDIDGKNVFIACDDAALVCSLLTGNVDKMDAEISELQENAMKHHRQAQLEQVRNSAIIAKRNGGDNYEAWLSEEMPLDWVRDVMSFHI